MHPAARKSTPMNLDTSLSQKALLRSEQELRALFEQSNDGIIIVREGKFADCNARISEMFGYSHDEFLQNTPQDLSPEYQPSGARSLDGIGAKIQNALSGETQEFYWKHKRKDGSLFDTDVTVSRFDIEDEVYLQIIVRDSTELRRIKDRLATKVDQLEQFVASNRELEQFAHTTAHDLKAPLNNIGGFIGLLDNSISNRLSTEEQEYMDFIKSGVRNMRQLIDDLLDYSKLNGSDQSVKQSIPTMQILEAVTQGPLRFELEQTGATIVYKDLPETLYGFEAKLRQVFQNLLTNAVKFRSLERPCRIEVRGEHSQGKQLIHVTDNGIGILPKYQQRIFEVFARLHSRAKYEGTGIGLATTRKIVQQHGGEIWVDSTGEGGSTFTVQLPKVIV